LTSKREKGGGFNVVEKSQRVLLERFEARSNFLMANLKYGIAKRQR